MVLTLAQVLPEDGMFLPKHVGVVSLLFTCTVNPHCLTYLFLQMGLIAKNQVVGLYVALI
jgi:hypothetical protein